MLDRHARCAELAGDAADAARALRELVAAREARAGRRRWPRRSADSRRSTSCRAIASTRWWRGGWRPRRSPRTGCRGEAAAERLVAAAYLQSARRSTAPRSSWRCRRGDEARRPGRVDLRARALGLEGVARAKRGEFEQGVATVRAGLALALEHGLTAEAAEVYQRLGTTLEVAADYVGAQAALETAVGLCRTDGAAASSTRA